jgi:hypothetical protein
MIKTTIGRCFVLVCAMLYCVAPAGAQTVSAPSLPPVGTQQLLYNPQPSQALPQGVTVGGVLDSWFGNSEGMTALRGAGATGWVGGQYYLTPEMRGCVGDKTVTDNTSCLQSLINDAESLHLPVWCDKPYGISSTLFINSSIQWIGQGQSTASSGFGRPACWINPLSGFSSSAPIVELLGYGASALDFTKISNVMIGSDAAVRGAQGIYIRSLADPITSVAFIGVGGGEVTFTTQNPHGFGAGSTVQVVGMTPSAYNGTYTAIAGTTGNTIIVPMASNPGAATVFGAVPKTATFGYAEFSNLYFWATNSWSFFQDNSDLYDGIGGMYLSKLEGGQFPSGIRYANTGPGNITSHPYITGNVGGVAFQMSQVPGDVGGELDYPNVADPGGAILITSGPNFQFHGGTVELGGALTGSSGAVIDISCADAVTYGISISGMGIGNISSSSSVTSSVHVGANCKNTEILPNWWYTGNATQQASGFAINDAGANTTIYPQAYQSPPASAPLNETGTGVQQVPTLNAIQTWSGVNTHTGTEIFRNGVFQIAGLSSGTLSQNCAATCGTSTLTWPAGTTNFSATGPGVVQQTSSGAPLTVATVPFALGGTGTSAGAEIVGGKLTGANFNSTADQSITITSPTTRYMISAIIVSNPSIALSTAAGGFYSVASKGGTPIVAASQVYSGLNNVMNNAGSSLNATLASGGATSMFNLPTLFLSLTTAQGAASTADVTVMIRPVP